jgi:hypothetical protein
MLSPQQMEEQRAAMEKARQEMAADRAAMEKTRQELSVDRAAMAKARQEMEAAMKAQAAKLQSDAGPELNKKMEELRQRLQGLAKAEAEKAKLLADQASKEADLAGREAALSRMEADHARGDADFKRLEAELLLPPAQSEIERRRQYAKRNYGGENTERGRILMQYGPPDEMEVHPGKGEDWRYESRGADRAVMDFHFDANGKLVSRTGSAFSPGERERRVKYANDKWAKQGGAASDKGNAYIKYGPPDEVQTHTSGGETWLYKNETKDQTRLEVTFDGNGKGQWVKQPSSAGPIGSSPSSHFQEAPDLR